MGFNSGFKGLNLDTARCFATQNRSGYLGSRSIYSAKLIQCIACLLGLLFGSVVK